MYSRVNGYNGYNNYRVGQLSPVTNRPNTQNGRHSGTSDSIFASSSYGHRSVGDTVELRGARRAEEIDNVDAMDEEDDVNGSSEGDDSPIGEAELSEADEKVLQAAMDDAGVPDSEGMEAIAREHLAAMSESGNSNNNSTTGTNATTANQDKIKKLSEFIKNYYEEFGDEEVTKSEYLQNVSQMMQADMEEEGKPYVDLNSGFFDAKNYSDPAAVAIAFKEVKDTGFETSNNVGNTGSTVGKDAGTGTTENDSIQNYQDFLTKNQDNPKYARLSAVERQNQMYQDYKYNRV